MTEDKYVELLNSSPTVKDQRRRESPAGYHYYWSYWENARNWYLKYVLGLRPKYTSPALVKGACIHEAITKYYLKHDIGDSIDFYQKEMELRREEYEEAGRWVTDLNDGIAMLDMWWQVWNKTEVENLTPLEIEKLHEFWIGPDNSLKFTVRADRIMHEKDFNKNRVYDTKTSGWSISKTIQNVEAEDQITGYIWAMAKVHPEWKIQDAVVDVLFKKNSVVKAERSDPIYRTKLDLAIFELNIIGTIIETTQKVKALKWYPWPILFPRNGRIAGIFGDPYEAISRIDVKPGQVPTGFIRDEWVEVKDLVDNIDLAKWDGFKVVQTEEVYESQQSKQ